MITPAFSPTATERVLPRLALDFTTAVLDSRVTVTRALNTATCINSSGYVQIVNANLPRFDYDPSTLTCKGLLIEETRSNLFTYSEQFDNSAWYKGNTTVTANQTTSPDGTTNADKLDFLAVANANIQPNPAVSVTAGASYTYSIYVKADSPVNNVKIAMQGSDTDIAIGTMWTRVTRTVTASGTTLSPTLVTRNSVATTIYIWGAQLEAGAFATSYIPTTTSSLTRNGDQVAMTGTNFSSWYNATGGTFAVEADSATVASVGFLLTADDGTNNNRFGFYRSSTALAGYVVTTGSTQMELTRTAIAANTAFKGAVAATANNGNFAFNSSLAAGDNTITMPTVTRLTIGGSAGTVAWFGHIAKISYWPQRLLNAELQAFSK